MRDGRPLIRGGLLSLLLVLLVAQSGFAYLGQTKYSVTVTADAAVVKCGKDVKLTATVLKVKDNSPVKYETVRWEIKSSPSRHDRLSDTTTRTNSQGKATVTLRLDDVQGVRVIKASFDGASGTTTVTCKKDDHGHHPWPPRWPWVAIDDWFRVAVRHYGPFWGPVSGVWH